MSPRTLPAAAALALAALLVPAGALAKPHHRAKADLTVMTRNLYLGADIIKLVGAADLAGEAQQVQALHQVVDRTSFPVRARGIAAEIASTRPDVIALQEVARYYRTADGAYGTPATTPLYDWMRILRQRLRARGQHYRVASEQTELDITVPSAEGYGLRLKLGNAVLVRTGRHARVSHVRGLSGQFTHQLQVALPGRQVDLHRGYAGIDGRVAGVRFRFLDPHAEAYSAADAEGQFRELLAGPAHSRTRPTIIAGDFNSDPADRGPNGYRTVLRAGFVDTGRRARTCCQVETVDNPVSQLKTWIDHIVVRPRARVLSSRLVGNRTSDRVGGLWPSDHAGVVARIRLP